jgi:hypothetical protein
MVVYPLDYNQQTITPGRNIIIHLLLQRDSLDESQLNEIQNFADKFDQFEAIMESVRQKGQELEHDEKIVNHH